MPFEDIIQDATGNSDSEKNFQEAMDEDFYLLYNPPAGGNPENIGKIIFCSQSGETQESGDYYLYTINPDGSNKTKLLDFGKFMRHPAWSPEYSRIAYSANVENKGKIFLMTYDGSKNKQLTFGESGDKFPTWSPDGNNIAYISYIGGTPNLFIIDIHGENKRQLTFCEDEDTVLWPCFSPVSDAIAYTYNKSGAEIGERIIIVQGDGTKILDLPNPSDSKYHFSEPSWSPDGEIIYFLSNQSAHVEVWKIDYYKLLFNLTADEDAKYDDLGLVQLTNLYGSGIAPSHRSRVSPDGNKIVFYGSGADWINIGTNLYIVNIEDESILNITKSTDGDEWPDW